MLRQYRSVIPWLLCGAALSLALFGAWPSWPVVVIASDVAEILPPETLGPYVPRAEKALACSLIGWGLTLLFAVAWRRSSLLAALTAVSMLALGAFYPTLRSWAFGLMTDDLPARLAVEASHPRLHKRLRFELVDPGFAEAPSGSTLQQVQACRISKGDSSVVAIANESGVHSLPRFLETESLGHDWIRLTYRDVHRTMLVEGLRSGGRHSRRLDRVLQRIIEGAEVVDERKRCHELWPFLVRPFEKIRTYPGS